MKNILPILCGIVTGIILTLAFWVVGLLTPLVVYTELIVPNFLLWWVISAAVMTITDHMAKSPAGDFPLDLLLLSPIMSVCFVTLMNIICSQDVWFAANMFKYGSWLGIIIYIIASVFVALGTKTWLRGGKE